MLNVSDGAQHACQFFSPKNRFRNKVKSDFETKARHYLVCIR